MPDYPTVIIATRELKRRDDALIIDVVHRKVWRNGRWISLWPQLLRILLCYAVPGREVRTKDLVEALTFDRDDGGPLWAYSQAKRLEWYLNKLLRKLDVSICNIASTDIRPAIKTLVDLRQQKQIAA